MTTADPSAAGELVRVEGASLDFLLELLDTPAPSGFEEPAGEVVERYASGWGDVRVDAVGNRIVTVNKGAGRRVMLVGHLDEIGFIVTHVDEHGLLRFEPIGGWDQAVAVGQRVRVLTSSGPRIGTIGRLAAHQLKAGREAEFRLRDLWIDIGAVDADDARSIVRPGDPIVIDARPHVYDNRRIMSRSADDRVGAFIAFETARLCAGCGVEVVAVGSTTEETSQVGAITAAYGIRPDEACVLDVTFTSDVPGEHEETVVIGGGPVITFGAATRSRIGAELVATARRLDTPVQLNANGTETHTDADEVVIAGEGVPTGVLTVPTRYLHTPGELFSLDDVEASIRLLVAWICGD